MDIHDCRQKVYDLNVNTIRRRSQKLSQPIDDRNDTSMSDIALDEEAKLIL